MSFKSFHTKLLFLCCFMACGHPSFAQKIEVEPISYADSVAKAAPAVVSIQAKSVAKTEREFTTSDPALRFFFGPHFLFDNQPSHFPEEKALGSGVVIDKEGHVLTNYHVIKGAKDIVVTLQDKNMQAKLLGFDEISDLAVLKINGKDLPVIPIGSSKKMRVGDVVLAIGNPYDIGQTVTQGIISATERSDLGSSLYNQYLQTDAAINPGNSGGALIDAKGNLIGINTAIYTRSGGNQGIGFAIPIDSALSIVKQLYKNGKILRGFLGVQLRELEPEIRRYFQLSNTFSGVFIAGITQNSPADKASLKPEDIIVEIDKKPVKNIQKAYRMITNLKPGQRCLVKIYRNKEYLTLSVMVGKR